MAQVIDPLSNRVEKEKEKVKFDAYLESTDARNWDVSEYTRQPSPKRKIVYMGKCAINGDMFYDVDDAGNICIFKGHLNSGEY